jgi:SAM-dependent methyltransferase
MQCLACGDVTFPEDVGDLRVWTCRRCGHGSLQASASDVNEHFESNAYVSWRTENQNWMTRRADGFIQDFFRVTGRIPQSAVEIGCATGEVLGALSRSGARCWGADLSATSLDIARRRHPGVTFVESTQPNPPEPVEAFLAFHVVEHVADPGSLLSEAFDQVQVGGYLYIRVPNYGGLARRVLRSRWPDYLAGHLHHFTQASMQRFLEDSGWCLVDVSTSANSWVWLGGFKRLLTRWRPGQASDIGAAPPGRRQLRFLDIADSVLRPLLWIEERLGRANELVVIARKPNPAL